MPDPSEGAGVAVAAPSTDENSKKRDVPGGVSRYQPGAAITILILGVLSAQFVGFGLWQAWRDAPTFDEPITVASGVTALTRHDLRINTEHPPLPKVLAAIPVLLAHPVIPYNASWKHGSGSFAGEFLQANQKAGKLREIIFLARLVPLLEGLLLGLAAFLLGCSLFGRPAGLLAAGALLTTPVIIGYSHLDGLDLPFALVAVLGSLALLRHLRNPTWGNAALVGLVGGSALLTRWTGLVLVPVLALIVAIANRRRLPRALLQAGVVLLVVWLTLWAGYRAIAPGGTAMTDGLLRDLHITHTTPASNIGERLLEHLPLPSEYKAGLRTQRTIEGSGNGYPFLLGQYWKGRHWWFWPGTLLIKMPATVLLLLAGAPLGLLALDRRRRHQALLAVGLPAFALAVATYAKAPQQIGIRYALPVVALAVIIAASIAVVAFRTRYRQAMIGIAIAAQLAFLLSAVPDSLAWTAPPFRPGYRVAVDSNLDLGQDFYRLEDWSKGHRPWIAWLGPIPAATIPGSRNLLIANPTTIRGYVAINATALTSLYHEKFSWLRAYCPTGTIGGTILLYRFVDAVDARPGPDTPALPCFGQASHRGSG
jgi:hypothetical protein